MFVLYGMLYGVSIAAIDAPLPFVLSFQLFEGERFALAKQPKAYPLNRPWCI